jgi:hypothetical protein
MRERNRMLTDIIEAARGVRATVDQLFDTMDGREWNADLWDEVAPLVLKLAGRESFESPDNA